eukprot:TRINITY_DN571_c0_g2_i1.p1 TRINITY_DN571_c0_g2~~TRINITY_DN571_c0_g2_i1.p1  ORF type:complete len:846 (+),score=185.11 TRINITY_DN571_c0_g2_i1:111-2648(+)
MSDYTPLPPQPCIEFNDGWRLCESARLELQRCHDRIACIAVVGNFRIGKSVFCSRLGKAVFPSDAGVKGFTKGFWMVLVKHKDRFVLILDSEGLSDIDQASSEHDIQLFVIALLLSSLFAYNINQNVNAQHITALAKAWRALNVNDPKLSGSVAPAFRIVIRDSFLERMNPFDHLRAREAETSQMEWEGQKATVRNAFRDRKYYFIPKPAQSLRDPDPTGKLRPFFSAMDETCGSLKDDVKVKKLCCKSGEVPMTGPLFVALVDEVLRQLNSNQKLDYLTLGDKVTQAIYTNLLKDALATVKEHMQQLELPIDATILKQAATRVTLAVYERAEASKLCDALQLANLKAEIIVNWQGDEVSGYNLGPIGLYLAEVIAANKTKSKALCEQLTADIVAEMKPEVTAGFESLNAFNAAMKVQMTKFFAAAKGPSRDDEERKLRDHEDTWRSVLYDRADIGLTAGNVLSQLDSVAQRLERRTEDSCQDVKRQLALHVDGLKLDNSMTRSSHIVASGDSVAIAERLEVLDRQVNDLTVRLRDADEDRQAQTKLAQALTVQLAERNTSIEQQQASIKSQAETIASMRQMCEDNTRRIEEMQALLADQRTEAQSHRATAAAHATSISWLTERLQKEEHDHKAEQAAHSRDVKMLNSEMALLTQEYEMQLSRLKQQHEIHLAEQDLRACQLKASGDCALSEMASRHERKVCKNTVKSVLRDIVCQVELDYTRDELLSRANDVAASHAEVLHDKEAEHAASLVTERLVGCATIAVLDEQLTFALLDATRAREKTAQTVQYSEMWQQRVENQHQPSTEKAQPDDKRRRSVASRRESVSQAAVVFSPATRNLVPKGK